MLGKIDVESLADLVVTHLCIPAGIVATLGLGERDRRKVTLADGATEILPYVGPIDLSFGNRRCCVGALVVKGDDVLIGAIPMADLDLIVQANGQVVVHPGSPDIARSQALVATGQSISALKGMIRRPVKPVSIADMNAAIAEQGARGK